MKHLSKKIIFMLILASHAHQAQAAQTALVSPATQAAELAAQTLQSAKYYWNYLKKSMRAGTAKAITIAQKHPQIFAAGALGIAATGLVLAINVYKQRNASVQKTTPTTEPASASAATTTSAETAQPAVDGTVQIAATIKLPGEEPVLTSATAPAAAEETQLEALQNAIMSNRLPVLRMTLNALKKQNKQNIITAGLQFAVAEQAHGQRKGLLSGEIQELLTAGAAPLELLSKSNRGTIDVNSQVFYSQSQTADQKTASPLFIALQKGHLKVADKLVELGANITSHDIFHYLLRHEKALEAHELIKIILETKSDGLDTAINHQDAANKKLLSTPLMYAISRGKIDVALLLIEHGANLNAQDFESGKTALHYVILYSENGKNPISVQDTIRIISALRNNRANFQIKDRNKLPRTALQYAKDWKLSSDTLDLLESSTDQTCGGGGGAGVGE